MYIFELIVKEIYIRKQVIYKKQIFQKCLYKYIQKNNCQISSNFYIKYKNSMKTDIFFKKECICLISRTKYQSILWVFIYKL